MVGGGDGEEGEGWEGGVCVEAVKGEVSVVFCFLFVWSF